MANGIIAHSEALVNDFLTGDVSDTVKFAEDEVRRTEDRLKKSRAAMGNFATSADLDPTQTAAAQLTLPAKLESNFRAKNEAGSIRSVYGSGRSTWSSFKSRRSSLSTIKSKLNLPSWDLIRISSTSHAVDSAADSLDMRTIRPNRSLRRKRMFPHWPGLKLRVPRRHSSRDTCGLRAAESAADAPSIRIAYLMPF